MPLESPGSGVLRSDSQMPGPESLFGALSARQVVGHATAWAAAPTSAAYAGGIGGLGPSVTWLPKPCTRGGRSLVLGIMVSRRMYVKDSSCIFLFSFSISIYAFDAKDAERAARGRTRGGASRSACALQLHELPQRVAAASACEAGRLPRDCQGV